MSYFGKNIKKIRSIKKLSQAKFAEIFNLTRGSIGAYEEGRAEAKIDLVIEIAKYFSITLEQLLSKEITINELYGFDIFKLQAEITDNEHNNEPKLQNVCYYVPKEFLALYSENFHNRDFLKQLPIIKLPKTDNLLSRAFEFYDENNNQNISNLHNGDILYCYLIVKQGISNILTGSELIIITDNILYGRLENSDNNIVIRTLGTNAISIIEMNEIKEIWKIHGVYSAKHFNKSNFDERLKNLEQRIKKIENIQ